MVFTFGGNHNSGKTALFNQLAGSNQYVGNFPCVTVGQKTGEITGYKDLSIVDLPGIYSLTPYTSEEILARDFLLKRCSPGHSRVARLVEDRAQKWEFPCGLRPQGSSREMTHSKDPFPWQKRN